MGNHILFAPECVEVCCHFLKAYVVEDLQQTQKHFLQILSFRLK